jgi:carbamoyltransferase
VHLGDQPKPLRGSYSLGSQYSDERIELALKRSGIPYCKFSDEEMIKKTALKLKEGKIVGWFQGRSEFGPRALGSRSILADATNPSMKKTINSKVKFREEFRPFAPMMLRKNALKLFKLKDFVNYEHMVVAAEFESSEIGRIRVPAVWHPNNLGRVQLIDDEDLLPIGKLLREADEKYDIPCLLNTSFNTAGEPLVETPEDAIATFVRSGIDVLVMSKFFVEK